MFNKNKVVMREQEKMMKSSLNAVGFAFDYIPESTLTKKEREQLVAEAKVAGEFVMDYALKQGKITPRDKKDSLINQAVARVGAAFEDAQKVNVYGDGLAKIKPPFFLRNGAPISAVEKPTKDDAIIGIANVAFALAWLAQKEGVADLKTLKALSGADKVIKEVLQDVSFGRQVQRDIRFLVWATESLAVRQGENDVSLYLGEREREMAAIGYCSRAKEVREATAVMKKIADKNNEK